MEGDMAALLNPIPSPSPEHEPGARTGEYGYSRKAHYSLRILAIVMVSFLLAFPFLAQFLPQGTKAYLAAPFFK
jgi:hypothetical protein